MTQREAETAIAAIDQYRRRHETLGRLYGPVEINGILLDPAGCRALLDRARRAETLDPDPVR